MAGAAKSSSRPLSPHLQVWRFHITMWVSILHRIAGGALYAGAVGVVLWLGALALGPAAYRSLVEAVPLWLAEALAAALLAAFAFHFANGVRHLFWDFGAGFRPATANATAWLVVLFSLAAPAAFLAYLHL